MPVLPRIIDVGEVTRMRLEVLALGELTMRCTLDWGTSTGIPCVGGPEFHGKVLDIGGWVIKRIVKIEVRIANLPSSADLPKPNDTVVFYNSDGATGVKYRINTVKNWYNASLDLECADTNS